MNAAEYLEELIQHYAVLVEEGREPDAIEYWDTADWAQQEAYADILNQLKELQNLEW